jgi:hypothetical protein
MPFHKVVERAARLSRSRLISSTTIGTPAVTSAGGHGTPKRLGPCMAPGSSSSRAIRYCTDADQPVVLLAAGATAQLAQPVILTAEGDDGFAGPLVHPVRRDLVFLELGHGRVRGKHQWQTKRSVSPGVTGRSADGRQVRQLRDQP